MNCEKTALATALVATALIAVGLPHSAATDQKPGDDSADKAVDSSKKDTLRAKLDDRVEFEFIDVPLSEAMRTIGEMHDLQFVIDYRALADAGYDSKTPAITAAGRGIRLKSLLGLMLEPHELAVVPDREVLRVTTKEEANNRLSTRIYDVLDLVAGDGLAERDFDYDPVIDLITRIVHPQTWDELGGPSTIEGLHGCIVITQTATVHEDIAEMLDAIRNQFNRQQQGTIDAGQIVGIGNRITPKLEKLLALPTTLEYDNVSLADVVRDLPIRVGISMHFDEIDLINGGIDPDEKSMKVNLRDVPLATALDELLDSVGLTWIFKHETPIVTPRDDASKNIVIGVYPVADLANARNDDWDFPTGEVSVEQLIDTITRNLDTQTWDDLGGPGSIESFGNKHPVLAIAQSQRVHRLIADYLQELRKTKATQAGQREKLLQSSKHPDQHVLRVYRIKAAKDDATAMSPQEVHEVVFGLLGADTWNTEGAYLQAVTGRLIVRQTPKVHGDVRRLLQQLEMLAHDVRMAPHGLGPGNHGYIGGVEGD